MNPEDYAKVMKRYVTVDIEGIPKEWSSNDWEEVETEAEYDDNFDEPKVKNPFSYSKMLEGVMQHLEKTGGVEFAILKDPELGRWWSGKVKERERAKKLKDAKDKLYSTMTAEELRILGIRTK